MQASYLNPFIEAISETLEHFTGSTTKRQGLDISKNFAQLKHPGNDLHIFLGITGELDGVIFFSTDKNSGLHLASKMVGMPLAALDELSMSTLQELLNMTSGNAVCKLENIGIKSRITTPTVVMGASLEIKVNYPIISIDMSANDARFTLSLSLCVKKRVAC